MKTLTKYEKDIVDNFFIDNNINTFDIETFNLILSICFPTWRSEQLVETDEAYIDYFCELLEYNQ